MKFKTTIKCSGCVANASPFLDKTVGKDNWKVDLLHPDRELTVNTSTAVSEQEVLNALSHAGYKAERKE